LCPIWSSELERLRESDTVRVIDSLAVYKDANGELEVEHLSNLSEQEAIELGTKIGAQQQYARLIDVGDKQRFCGLAGQSGFCGAGPVCQPG
jgi:hypothetical protein